MTVVEGLYEPLAADFQDVSHDVYRRLRDEFPVYQSKQQGQQFYTLSRFDDVLRAAHDPDTFSSDGTDPVEGLMPMIVFMDPPRHDELRALVSRAFTPRRVAELEPRVREITRGLIDDFANRGAVDIVPSLAAPLPSLVIAKMIGVPDDYVERFRSWSEQLIEFHDPADGSEHITNIYTLFVELLDARRRERQDDLMSALLDAEIDGRRLSDEELLGFCFILIVGGNDTTTSLIGNGVDLLARHPQQRASLVRDPALLANAIEEMLRLEPPAQVLFRRTTREVELHGVTIPAGAAVNLVWAAANLDEREFDDPERFDVSRKIDRHLAFGHGLHCCLGASLARLEARVAFEELLARIPEYDVVSAERHCSPWARAFKALHIRF